MDADNAPGPLAAYRAMEKAIAKAKRNGIGMATIRNSNHFMGAAPYALLAADSDMLGIAIIIETRCSFTARRTASGLNRGIAKTFAPRKTGIKTFAVSPKI